MRAWIIVGISITLLVVVGIAGLVTAAEWGSSGTYCLVDHGDRGQCMWDPETNEYIPAPEVDYSNTLSARVSELEARVAWLEQNSICRDAKWIPIKNDQGITESEILEKCLDVKE